MEKKGGTMSRQSSATCTRRGSTAILVLTSQRCRIFMCLGLLFATGIIFGVVFAGYVFSSFETVKRNFMFEIPGQEYSSRTGTPEKKCSTDEVRPGLSVRKNLSVQFRDYLPRRIFINVAMGPPDSLELFLETYSDAHKFTLFTFLADKSYTPLYSKFKNLRLFPSIVPSTENSSTSMSFPAKLGVLSKLESPVIKIDFPAWLKENMHPDEYVVVKMSTDSHNERAIVDSLVTSGALEWCDKYYTTSTDDDVIEDVQEKFLSFGQYIDIWDDQRFTYSDFDEVNEPNPSKEASVLVKECQEAIGIQFAMLLYMKSITRHSAASVTLLQRMMQKYRQKLPLALFVPAEYLGTEILCDGLANLSTKLELGLFVQERGGPWSEAQAEDINFNLMRNMFVSVEHCFARGNLTLNYVMAESSLRDSHSPEGKMSQGKVVGKPLLKEVIDVRHYTFFTNVQDVTAVFRQQDADLQLKVMETGSGGLLAMDISAQGADAALLRMLEKYITKLVPTHVCVQGVDKYLDMYDENYLLV